MRKEKRWLSASLGIVLVLVTLCIFGLLSSDRAGQLRGEQKQPPAYQVWPSEPPADCPFPKSTVITGIAFTGRHVHYDLGDTWFPSWASDGKMYSNWTDGEVNGVKSTSALIWGAKIATTGYAAVLGDDPLHLTFADVGVYTDNPGPYIGRYPSANLFYNGVWYYGTYGLTDSDGDPTKGLNYDILGPFIGFRYSKDYGKTWTDTRHTAEHPIFGEPAKVGGKLKMGAPHVVDFGKNMQYSPDGKAYLVAHGAVDPDPKPRPANLSWITGDQIYMARVTPSPQTIDDATKYEFFAGHDAQGNPVWTHDFLKIKPLVDWNNNCGCVTMTYDPGLKKYLMCINDGGNTISRFNTYILESNRITGPWKLVVYMKSFGEQAYFVNIPSKFVSSDGRTAWLCYSSNFTNGYLHTNYKDNPPGGGVGMVLQEVRLLP